MRYRHIFASLVVGTAITTFAASPSAAQATQRETDSPADDAGSPVAQSGVAEIIVTAQRRGENLQDVPVAVDVATGEALETFGLSSTADLGVVAPAVTFAVGLGGAAPTIRGVGGTGAGTDESANAVYIDGVYVPSPQAALFQFNNIERVEVLKGPQGTLFGRNASGGLIQIITRTPDQHFSANFEVGYGNYDTFRAAGTIAGGLADGLAASISGVIEDQGDGWGTNIVTGEDAYRGQFHGLNAIAVWDIGPDTRVRASAIYAASRPAGVQGHQILPGELTVGGFSTGEFYDQILNEALIENSNYNYALTFEHHFDWATFTSITSRDVSTSDLIIDADLGPVPLLVVDIDGPKRSWTQEFQLASPSDSPIQWLLGAFYYRGAWFQDPSITRGNVVAPLAFRATDSRQLTNSYALYGQTTFPVTSRTDLTVGLRYTIDKREHDVTSYNSNPAIAPVTFPTEFATDKKLTWRLAIDHEFSDDVMAFASYSRGFKSGLYNIGNTGNPPVEPQTIDAYEIGLKTDLLDRSLRLNLSAFRYDISDIQLRTTVPPNPTPIFFNAAQSRVYGVEAAAEVYFSSRFSVTGNVAYLSGEYTDFPNAVYFFVKAPPATGLNVQTGVDATGNETVFTPEWVTNLSARYQLPTSIGDFTFGATWTYNDGYFYDPQNRLTNPSHHLINATLTWEPDDNFFVRAYVRNLLGEEYYTTVQPTNFGDLYFPAAPRTYGVTLGVEF